MALKEKLYIGPELYILRTKNRKLKISIDLIEKSSLAKLKDELKKLDAQWV